MMVTREWVEERFHSRDIGVIVRGHLGTSVLAEHKGGRVEWVYVDYHEFVTPGDMFKLIYDPRAFVAMLKIGQV